MTASVRLYDLPGSRPLKLVNVPSTRNCELGCPACWITTSSCHDPVAAPGPTFCTVQPTWIVLPSSAVVGALTFVTVRSGGGVRLIVNGAETVTLSVPLP